MSCSRDKAKASRQNLERDECTTSAFHAVFSHVFFVADPHSQPCLAVSLRVQPDRSFARQQRRCSDCNVMDTLEVLM